MATTNKPDVIIIGAGIFGLSCAWSCLKRGMSVMVLERDTIGAGASGGVMGSLSPNVPETWSNKKQLQLDALLSAADHWAEIERASGMSTGYGRIGRLLPIIDERALGHAQQRALDAPELWMGKAEWTIRDTESFTRWISPDLAPFGVVYETLSARIAPLAACLALAGAIRSRGGIIREGWRVDQVNPHEVSGPDGAVQADAIIVCAGAQSFELVAPYIGAGAGFGVKGQAALFGDVDMTGAPLIFADHTYIIPHANGQVAIGSTTENTWSDPYSVDEKLESVIAKARALCPALAKGTVIQRWANLRPRGKKPEPMLGAVPGAPNVFLASGGFKIGIGISHAVGDILAGIVAGETPYVPEKFLVRLAKPAQK